MLDYLGGVTGEIFDSSLEIAGLPAHLYGLVTHTGALTGDGETALFRLITAAAGDDLGVEHFRISAIVVEDYNALEYANHICRHAYTTLCVCLERVHKVVRNRHITVLSGNGRTGKKYGVVDNGSDHKMLLKIRVLLNNITGAAEIKAKS